ncbi:hypothetical protein TGRUB_261955A [Toxoplasma gondii RUB]|uniref:Uncharacterized protein n=1 Tax=Toxoplasma gondii RUB TaxID=935652 RepID=A0A086M966_TOXGO|nr:hypothetical protein TGRUB_261955A [Toxoplasma gondii RUB]
MAFASNDLFVKSLRSSAAAVLSSGPARAPSRPCRPLPRQRHAQSSQPLQRGSSRSSPASVASVCADTAQTLSRLNSTSASASNTVDRNPRKPDEVSPGGTLSPTSISLSRPGSRSSPRKSAADSSWRPQRDPAHSAGSPSFDFKGGPVDQGASHFQSKSGLGSVEEEDCQGRAANVRRREELTRVDSCEDDACGSPFSPRISLCSPSGRLSSCLRNEAKSNRQLTRRSKEERSVSPFARRLLRPLRPQSSESCISSVASSSPSSASSSRQSLPSVSASTHRSQASALPPPVSVGRSRSPPRCLSEEETGFPEASRETSLSSLRPRPVSSSLGGEQAVEATTEKTTRLVEGDGTSAQKAQKEDPRGSSSSSSSFSSRPSSRLDSSLACVSGEMARRRQETRSCREGEREEARERAEAGRKSKSGQEVSTGKGGEGDTQKAAVSRAKRCVCCSGDASGKVPAAEEGDVFACQAALARKQAKERKAERTVEQLVNALYDKHREGLARRQVLKSILEEEQMKACSFHPRINSRDANA